MVIRFQLSVYRWYLLLDQAGGISLLMNSFMITET